MIRAVIFSATVAALVVVWRDQPKPVQTVQVAYCVIDQRVAGKHPITGEWVFAWAQMYGPCDQQDKFFEI